MHSESAYVLHHRWLNERTLIVCLFGENTGRFDCACPKKKAPQLGARYTIQWHEHPSGLHKMRHAELQGPIYHFRQNDLVTQLYLHELMCALLPLHVDHSHIFKQYTKTLAALSQKENHSLLIRYFEQTLLCELGHGLDASYLPPQTDGWISYHIDQGFTWSDAYQEGWFSLSSIRRLLTHTMTKDDLVTAKIFLSQTISQLAPNKKWYSKNMYISNK